MQVIFLPTSICVIWYLQIKPFVIVTLTLDGEKAACNKQEAKKKKNNSHCAPAFHKCIL